MYFNAYTNKGNFRETNEDDFLLDTSSFSYDIAAVADGMGGHQAGEVASKMAVNYLQGFQFNLQSDIMEEIGKVIRDINQKLIKMADNNLEYRGMGTTLSLIIIDKNILYLGHVGDSRIYLYRNNKLSQLTTDDTLVQKMIADNKIEPEEAFNHPRSNILTQGLGIDTLSEVETAQLTLQKKDLVLLCTDGLSDMFRKQEIEDLLSSLSFRKQTNYAQKLGRRALKRGAKDNITVITGLVN